MMWPDVGRNRRTSDGLTAPTTSRTTVKTICERPVSSLPRGSPRLYIVAWARWGESSASMYVVASETSSWIAFPICSRVMGFGVIRSAMEQHHSDCRSEDRPEDHDEHPGKNVLSIDFHTSP